MSARKIALVVIVALGAATFTTTSASGKVLRNTVGHLSGQGAPDGPLGLYLLSDAVDDSTGLSSGDVYVLETGNETLGQGLVDKFTATGSYAGVQITGAQTGPGSFEFGPFESGVAVDGSASLNSGDVYVADTGHHVIDRFSESGVFECQIAGSETEAEDPSVSECDPAGSAIGGVIRPSGLAVDGSGDVYVADDEHAEVQELGPEGDLIRTIKGEGPKGEAHLSSEMGTIALDSSGDLYVTNVATGVVQLGPAGEYLRELGSFSFGVAVDQSTTPNRVYVDQGQQLSEFDPSGTLRDTVTLPGTFWPGLAVDQATGNLYAASAQFAGGTPEGVEILGPATVLPNVATEAAGELGEASAVLHATVEPDSAHGGGNITSCEFEYVTEAQYTAHPASRYEGAATAPCEAPVSLPYTEAEHVKATVTLSPSTTYHFRVLAADAEGANDGEGEANPEQTFATLGPPVVASESAVARTRDATLTARIDPFGFATTCEVQYVDEADFNASGYAHAGTLACPQALGAGFAEDAASVTVSGLTVGSTYHYRFIASNAAGPSTGADETFATFGIHSFTFETLDAEWHPYAQAGGHPYVLRTSFALNTSSGEAQANVKDTETQLPPGLIGSPTAVAQCTREQLTDQQCPGAAQVGIITLQLSHGAFEREPLYNLVPPQGVPAEFGVRFNTYTNVYVDSNVRTGGDYGVTARVSEASAAAGVIGATVELWGVPAAASHDAQRFCPAPGFSKEQSPCSAGVAPAPFLREPTSCGGELHASMSVDAWQDPGAFVSQSASMPALTGCELPDFTPSLSLAPSTSEADSPSGLALDLKLPQDQPPGGVGESDLSSATVALPAGMSANPSAAAGLQACSPAQISLDADSEPSCPQASKIGTVEIQTPLLTQIVQGSVYVAEQDNNPFGSLLAIYIVAQADGALVKLAGHVQANPETGQLTTSFQDLPQLPFSELRLHLFGGPRGVLATPEACGGYATASTWGPWSAIAPVDLASPFSISSGCVAGFHPGFLAGVSDPQAGAYTPLELSFSRGDDEQQPAGLSATLPPGLVARIAGVALCGEAQANAGNCPEASQIGTVSTAAGAGPSPISLPGRIYLTGPYKGAPYGESVVVPAIAGPYDLGDVVVRGQIRIDPTTAQATVLSEPFPTILQGIPVKLRSVQVAIDRPAFVFNPTSCDPMALTGVLHSTGGLTAAVSSRFQVADCAGLQFKPKLSVSTAAKASKLNGVSLKFRITYPKDAMGSQSWIKEMKFDIPKQLPARLTTLQKACLAATFEHDRAACPAASIIGHVLVRTPVLPVPLEGPLYFVSYGGAAFPDAVAVLHGDGITIESHGHTLIKNRVTSATFEAVPDVPFQSIEVTVPQGPFSEFGANLPNGKLNFCGHKLTMPVFFKAQNGLEIHQNTPVGVTGCSTKLTLSSHRVKAHNVTLSVYVPAAGRLTVGGKGLSSATKRTTGIEDVTFTVHPKHRGKSSKRHIRLLFTPAHSRKQTLTITLRA